MNEVRSFVLTLCIRGSVHLCLLRNWRSDRLLILVASDEPNQRGVCSWLVAGRQGEGNASCIPVKELQSYNGDWNGFNILPGHNVIRGTESSVPCCGLSGAKGKGGGRVAGERCDWLSQQEQPCRCGPALFSGAILL